MRSCVVLGAGASLANALHFRGQRMRETRPPLDTTFFDVVAARSIAISGPLQAYLSNALRLNPDDLGGQRMERVFADVFYDFTDAPGTKGYLDAYIDLVDLYLRVIRETTNWLSGDSRTGAPIGRLLAAAAAKADELDIITFNHDLVIENEIQRRAQLRARWCLDECYGSMSTSLTTLLPPAGTPVFQLHRSGSCDHGRPIRLLKLHGSLNWVVRLNSTRPTAGLLSGQQAPTPRLLARRQLPNRVSFVRRGGGRGRQKWNLWPLVVPPVYREAGSTGEHASGMDRRPRCAPNGRPRDRLRLLAAVRRHRSRKGL
jgi:hypothetical protein